MRDFYDFINEGDEYFRQKKFDEALKTYNNALSVANPRDFAKAFMGIANVYHGKGDVDNALAFYKKALAAKKKHNPDSNDLDGASIYNNLGMLYKYKKRPLKALKYFEKSLKIKLMIQGQENIDHRLLSSSYNNIADVYQAIGNQEESFKYRQKAFEVESQRSINHEEGNMANYQNIVINALLIIIFFSLIRHFSGYFRNIRKADNNRTDNPPGNAPRIKGRGLPKIEEKGRRK